MKKAVSVSLADLNSAVVERSNGRLQAIVVGPTDVKLSGVAPLAIATRSDLAFLANPLYRADALKTRAGAIVLSAADRDALQSQSEPLTASLTAMAVCEQPYVWFAYAAQILRPDAPVKSGMSAAAHVADSAKVDASACVDAGAMVGEGAVIGAGAWIGAGAVIGARAIIGDATRIYPRAVVLDDCRIGARCNIHSGAVIGSDGFGFAPFDGRWIKIPQLGAVVIGDDVEIGANTTIDRGAMDDTIIEDGVKLDNQIQIAHNCVIGADTVIAACVGIAGSTRIGKSCRIGGAAMIAGHLTIADGSSIGPATAVPSSVTESGHYTGFFPPMKHKDWERAAAVVRNLPDLRSRLRQLESEHKASDAKADKVK
jgi:UDP-3-O-[3-hydroxymyristoyl] glucosamine N-acyltransferase